MTSTEAAISSAQTSCVMFWPVKYALIPTGAVKWAFEFMITSAKRKSFQERMNE